MEEFEASHAAVCDARRVLAFLIHILKWPLPIKVRGAATTTEANQYALIIREESEQWPQRSLLI